jgi:uncharacterized RDD family membrane protein YckC
VILHEVISTEKVPFHYRVAGPGSRFLAWLIDLLTEALFLIAGSFYLITLEQGRQGLGVALMLVWSFLVTWGYFVCFEWLWHGQTPGKRALGIRVISREGTSVTFVQSALRNILRIADALPVPPFCYGLGLAVAACNRESRRLGDLAAGTLVVHVEGKRKPIQALHDRTDEAYRRREAHVRQRVEQLDRQQKQTLLELCLRREQLRVADRARLFRATADYFKERLDLAPEEYQSDEKFVLQLAAVLGERHPAEAEPRRARPGEPPGLSRRG